LHVPATATDHCRGFSSANSVAFWGAEPSLTDSCVREENPVRFLPNPRSVYHHAVMGLEIGWKLNPSEIVASLGIKPLAGTESEPETMTLIQEFFEQPDGV
jgi:hypothetical protein